MFFYLKERATNILRFNSRVVVQGCGPIGLICIAVLRTMGIENIVAVDGNEQRLAFAKRMGAGETVMHELGASITLPSVRNRFQADILQIFYIQVSDSPVAHSNI